MFLTSGQPFYVFHNQRCPKKFATVFAMRLAMGAMDQTPLPQHLGDVSSLTLISGTNAALAQTCNLTTPGALDVSRCVPRPSRVRQSGWNKKLCVGIRDAPRHTRSAQAELRRQLVGVAFPFLSSGGMRPSRVCSLAMPVPREVPSLALKVSCVLQSGSTRTFCIGISGAPRHTRSRLGCAA
jgi:hypothetical protein